MPISRCPGQDQRFWKPDDVFESPCRSCGETVENPRFDLGCAMWCQYAEACLGTVSQPAEDRTVADALVREMRDVLGG